jgi:hypothetical protein
MTNHPALDDSLERLPQHRLWYAIRARSAEFSTRVQLPLSANLCGRIWRRTPILSESVSSGELCARETIQVDRSATSLDRPSSRFVERLHMSL